MKNEHTLPGDTKLLSCWTDPIVPTCLRSQENFHLIDGGLLINAPYPSFLGEKREIDLIIAPEYSAGEMFEVWKVCVSEWWAFDYMPVIWLQVSSSKSFLRLNSFLFFERLVVPKCLSNISAFVAQPLTLWHININLNRWYSSFYAVCHKESSVQVSLQDEKKQMSIFCFFHRPWL